MISNDGWGLPADAPQPVRMYQGALPRGRYAAFSMTPIDRTGVPAWKAALFLDDAALLPGAMPSGYGYGSTDGEALTGAVAEIAEMIAPTLRLQGVDKRMGSYADLVRALGARHVADPLTLGLPAGSHVGRDTPLAWIAAARAATGEPVWVPMDVGALDYFELPDGYKPFTTLITNGLGAGPDLDWAIGHGLYECLQRDGNGLRFRALDAGVLLDLPSAAPEDASDDLRETLALIARLDALGITVLPKFATDEFGLANVYVVGFDREGFDPAAPIMLSACGEACDPDRDRALRKAVLEFCSARARKAYGHGPMALARRVAPSGYIEAFLRQALPSLEGEESRALREMTAWARMSPAELRAVLAPVYAVRAHKPFATLPRTPCADARARGALARGKLEAEGLDVLYVDCSPADGSCAVVKVIVPGLEVETMSYHRIGERNTRKLIEADSPLIRFGPVSETLKPVRLSPEAAERLRPWTGGRAPRLDVAAVDAAVGALYPLYREPEAHHVAYRLGQVEAAA